MHCCFRWDHPKKVINRDTKESVKDSSVSSDSCSLKSISNKNRSGKTHFLDSSKHMSSLKSRPGVSSRKTENSLK